MRYLNEGFNMKLLIVPLMVRVVSFVHAVIRFVGKLASKLKIPAVSHFQMAIRTKQDAIAESVSAAVFSWLPVMRLPTSALAFGTVAPNKFFVADGAPSSLPVPSFLYSVRRKGHSSTSEVSNPRVKNGWVRNEDMWVLIRDGVSYNIAVMYSPPWGKRTRGEYVIFRGSKAIGSARTLAAAKRRAERIKTPRSPFK